MNRYLGIAERIWSKIFGRAFFRKMNVALNYLSFAGLGVHYYENGQSIQYSEISFLRSLAGDIKEGDLILDVGANVGEYSKAARKIFGNKVRIIAIEPEPMVYRTLAAVAEEEGFESMCLGCGSSKGPAMLYNESPDETELASIYAGVFGLPPEKLFSTAINLDTLDNLSEKFGWPRIRLLKIDTEGSEMEILKGARRLLRQGAIDFIQFEFNEMNLVSGVRMRDIEEYLPGYEIFRMLRCGIVSLAKLGILQKEAYGYQNLVAVRKK